MNPKPGKFAYYLFPSLFVFSVLSACECDDEGFTQVQVPAVDPARADPEVDPIEVDYFDRWVDQFNQRDGALDILWVIDPTGSMTDHLERIGQNFDAFVDVMVDLGVDYRLAVTTTEATIEAGGGVLLGDPAILTPEHSLQELFIERVGMDIDVGAEQGLEAARMVLTSGIEDFPRKEAMLAVILLTDDDDNSFGSPGFYTRFFLGLKGPGNDDLVRVSAIAGDVPDGCKSPGFEDVWGAGAAAAHKIKEVVDATGGIMGSICQEDFGPDLDRIGMESAGLRRIFPLSYQADADDIIVTVDGTEIDRDEDDGWVYDRAANSIRFNGDYVPDSGAQIQVNYGVVL